MTVVEIWHNVATDDRGNPVGFFGYRAGHPVVKVYEVAVAGDADTTIGDLAELAFLIGNGESQEGAAYYARTLRSVSAGDLVRVEGIWLAYGSSGWSVVEDHTPCDITTGFTTRLGTTPWRP
ncbi:hypothetical protein AGRA3207_007507 [Actinomadura graeca]|uniref:Uncharacterized protein n=1 Tax=Actinomadura graeca TaxID=2750812 RepID=A0ABX8R518_9ACTN|nr:hypothetical protein [Actinomadura graeca]QXJ25938.1 hypothetical protein AGRA3207_007507 [Actinomadura graeca]